MLINLTSSIETPNTDSLDVVPEKTSSCCTALIDEHKGNVEGAEGGGGGGGLNVKICIFLQPDDTQISSQNHVTTPRKCSTISALYGP
jgi:hypothetical protein